MEKYCTNCGSVFDDLNYKICPYCGEQLSEREGRQPIPRQLRHEVFVRDGYRCKECGASVEDGATLEIDHIIPVAKGGTNDIDNLQTLCKECNRSKYTDEWVGGETNLLIAQNELRTLEEQLTNAKIAFDNAINEDDKIDYKFLIMKIEESIENVKSKIEELKLKELENKQQEIEKERKEKLFRKLYVTLTDHQLKKLKQGIYIVYKKSVGKKNLFKQVYTADQLLPSKDDIIAYMINNFNETEINNILDAINDLDLQKEEFKNIYGDISFCILGFSDAWYYYYKLSEKDIGRLYAYSEDELKEKVLSKNLPWNLFDYNALSKNNKLLEFINGLYSEENFGSIDKSISKSVKLNNKDMRKKVLPKLGCNRDCDPSDDLFKTVSLTPQITNKLISCPNCGKQIKENAIRCKYCKTMLKK